MPKQPDNFVITEPGVYDLSTEAYHADPCQTPSLSSSIGKLMLNKSALHAAVRHPKLAMEQIKEEKDTFDLGTAAHTMLLGKGSRFVVHDGDSWRGKIDGETSAEWKAKVRVDGMVPILASQYQRTEEMVAACREQLQFTESRGAFNFSTGKTEQALVWREQTSSGVIWCRCLIDWLPDKIEEDMISYDYKTTEDAHPDVQEKRTYNLGYDFQAAFYRRGVKAVFGLHEARIRFINQERDTPYCISQTELTPSAMELANREVLRAMEFWAMCLAEDIWPPYPARVCYINPPAWAEKQKLEREEREPIDKGMIDRAIDANRPL
jgi:hypothetical protein